MVCANCGTANAAERRFCMECGAPLAAACAACGAPNEPAAKFCGACGARLGGQSAGATPGRAAAGRTDEGGETGRGTGPGAAERRLVSVLFADLVGFTTLAADRDPEATRELLTRYFAVAGDVIERYGGIVEKFIGDAVMAVWGAPTAHEDDAERAVRAALELVDAVRALSDPGSGLDLCLRAGVLTGEAAVTLGARGQGMVAGDLVNTASRLQSVAPPGGVLVGEATRRAVGRVIAFEAAGDQVLKGKVAPVAAFLAVRVVGERGGSGPLELVDPPFVGRDDELRLLKDVLHATGRERRARLVSIVGQAGIGKTRLAWELEKYLEGVVEPIYWHIGRSPAYGAATAFRALAEMVRQRARVREEDDPAAVRRAVGDLGARFLPDPAERARVEPRLLALLGVASAPPGGREELFAAWRTLFERIAEQGTTMLVFEDLHWADDGLLDFVDHLLDWSRSHPILIVTLARPELLDRRPGWGTNRPNEVAVRLEPLGDTAMRALLAGLVPGLPESAIEAIRGRAAGIPLYAVEIVRMLLSDGSLVEADGAYRPARDLSALQPPESLVALIGARLDGLDAADRALVQDASVLGGRFTIAALAAVAGADPAGLEARLRALARREVLELDTDPRSQDRGRYGFVQALFREVAYSTLARRDRRARHLAAARHYEALGEEHSGPLAEQYLAAYRSAPDGPEGAAAAVQARVALRAAAERAVAVGAWEQATEHLRAAREIASDDRDAAAALRQAGEYLIYGGRYAEATGILREAVALLTGAGERSDVLGAAGMLAQSFAAAGRIGEAVELLDPLVPEYEAVVDDASAARFAEGYSRALFRSARSAEALPWCDRAIARAEAAGLALELGHALVTKASVLIELGHRREGMALLRGTRDILREEGTHWVALRATVNIASFSVDDDPRGAFGIARDGMEESIRLGLLGFFTYLLGNAFGAAERIGEWDYALDKARVGLDLLRDQGARDYAAFIVASIGAWRGEDCHAVLEATLRTAEAAEDPQTIGNAAGSLGREAFAQGRYDDGIAWHRRQRENGTYNGNELAWAARCALHAGDAAGLAALDAEIQATPGTRAVAADRRFLQAAVAAAAGRREEALAGFRAAIDMYRDDGCGFDLAVTVLDAAMALGPEAATELGVLDEARATLLELGATPLLVRLESVVGSPLPA